MGAFQERGPLLRLRALVGHVSLCRLPAWARAKPRDDRRPGHGHTAGSWGPAGTPHRSHLPDEQGPPVGCLCPLTMPCACPSGLDTVSPGYEIHFLSVGWRIDRLAEIQQIPATANTSTVTALVSVWRARTLTLTLTPTAHPHTHAHASSQLSHTHSLTLTCRFSHLHSHTALCTHTYTYTCPHTLHFMLMSTHTHTHLLTRSHALAWLLVSPFCDIGDVLSHLGTSEQKLLPAPLPRPHHLSESLQAQLQSCLPQEGSPVFPSLLGPPLPLWAPIKLIAAYSLLLASSQCSLSTH